MTSLFSAEGIWFWTVGLKIYFPHFPISFSSGLNAVMIGSLSPKPSMFPLLGFSLITAISGILHCNPSPDIWLSSTEYILLGNPMCNYDFRTWAEKISQMWNAQSFPNVSPDFRFYLWYATWKYWRRSWLAKCRCWTLWKWNLLNSLHWDIQVVRCFSSLLQQKWPLFFSSNWGV